MRLFKRNRLPVRAFAAFFAAYCVVASARALIPGLCATLTALEHDDPALCRSPEHACCRPAPAESSAESIAAPEVHCAFCALVHAVAHSVSVPEIGATRFTAPVELAAPDFYVPNAAGLDAYARRGPPIA